MRINEILNVPEQLGLWQLINDTVLKVLTQQASQTGNQQPPTQSTVKAKPNSTGLTQPTSQAAKPTVKTAVKPQLRNPVKYRASTLVR